MRKKVVIVLLGSMILPATVWAQYKPYNRQNTSGYVFDGHKLGEVVVKPYEQTGDDQTTFQDVNGRHVANHVGNYVSRTITVAKKNDLGKEDYDDQVVYLYNPAAGLFLNVSGTWGTEAVGLYPGFGLAFNIVDPAGSGDLTDANYNNVDGGGSWSASGKWGVGFYSESSNQGHYLSRDGDKHAGEPVFQDADGNNISKIRFYTDRGWHDNNEPLHCQISGSWSYAENNHIFTWHFEKIDKEDPNLNVYRLCQYIRNYGRDVEGVYDKTKATVDDFHKHYVKFEKINPFGSNPYYALTTARANEVEWKGEDNEQHRFVDPDNLISTEERPEDVDSYADKDFYEWQIITRRDLKEKFLLDFNDPYATKPELGNANFNIENPDFNRPLNATVANSGAVSWKDVNGAYDYSSWTFDNAPYGRYAYLHPKKSGTFTQEFEPYQFGLFDVDVQGFTLNAHGGSLPTAKLSVTTTKAGSKIVTTEPVEFDEISKDDRKDLYQRIGDIARENLNREWHYKYQINDDSRGVINSHVFTYTKENPEPSSDGDGVWQPGFRSVRRDNGGWGLYPIDFNNYDTKCLYLFNYVDDFGRVCKGIYINGNSLRSDGKLGPWENGKDYFYSWKVNNDPWTDAQSGEPYAEVHVNVGDKVEFGPHIGVNVDADNRCQWWTPRGNATRNRSLTIENITYDDAGDYILTYHTESDLVNDNNKWNAVCYRLIVDTPLGLGDDELTPPEAGYVNVNGTGLPYAISNDQNVSVSHELVPGDPKSFSATGVKGFQNAYAATDKVYLERGIGSFLYDEKNKDKYRKVVTIYVPEGEGNVLEDVKVTLDVTDVTENQPVKSIAAIDNARLTYRGDTPYILDDNNVINKDKSFSTGNSRIPVYMNRQFNKGAWNAFVCPLPLNLQQVTDAFGEKVVVAEITQKGLDENYPYRILFQSKDFSETPKTAQVILPGHFYLVKPSDLDYQPVAQVNIKRDGGGTITKIDAVSYESNGEDVKVSTDEGVKNIGTGYFSYLGTHDLRLPGAEGPGTGDELAIPVTTDGGGNVVVNTGAFEDYEPYGDGGKYPTDYPHGIKYAPLSELNTPYRRFYAQFYAGDDEVVVPHNSIVVYGSYVPQDIKEGSNYVFATKEDATRLVHLKESGSSVQRINGFRFYIHDIEADAQPTAAKPFTFVVDGVEDGDEAAEISNAVIEESVATGDIYTIAGQKVTGTLGKGVYVKNGKKFLVK